MSERKIHKVRRVNNGRGFHVMVNSYCGRGWLRWSTDFWAGVTCKVCLSKRGKRWHSSAGYEAAKSALDALTKELKI